MIRSKQKHYLKTGKVIKVKNILEDKLVFRIPKVEG